MCKINYAQITRLKGKTCLQKFLPLDEARCWISIQAVPRLPQNTTESSLLPLKRLLANAGLRVRAWPQWERPRDCRRWKVAPKAQPVSMLFTFFVSCWGGEKKVFTFHSIFNFSKHDIGREYLQRPSTWSNQGKTESSQSLEASPFPASATVPLLKWPIAPTLVILILILLA